MPNCNSVNSPSSAAPHNRTKLTNDELYGHVLSALRQWHDPAAFKESVLSRLWLVRQAQQEHGGNLHKSVNHVLGDALVILEQTQPEFADVIRLRFWDKLTARQLENRLALSSTAFSRLQRDAVKALTEIIIEAEATARAELRINYEMRLEPPSYSQLFGIDEPLAQLLELAAPESPPWLITIEGMGGIGKTTLADAALRAAIQQDLFADYAWVSARQYRFQPSGMIQNLDAPALTADQLVEDLCTQLLGESALPRPFSAERTIPILLEHLSQTPALIVVDNLETLADVNELLPTLQRLSNPSKFVLTSRQNIHGETPTFPYKVPSLSEDAALALVRHEANDRNQFDLAAATDADLRPIYSVAGGNPLALRLVVGQTGIHDLSTVLNALRNARGEAVDNLYTFIYRYAWDNLDEQAQRILLAMPLVSELGETGDFIEGIVDGIPVEQVRDGLQQLVSLNLVNRLGDYSRRLYTIHNLTRTFLLRQVAKWV